MADTFIVIRYIILKETGKKKSGESWWPTVAIFSVIYFTTLTLLVRFLILSYENNHIKSHDIIMDFALSVFKHSFRDFKIT